MYYIVKCFDDDGHYVMATHRLFETRESALEYFQSISPARMAFIAPVEIVMLEDPTDEDI